MNARTLSMRLPMILAVGAIGLAFTVRMSAQVESSTATDTTGHNKTVSVEKGTVAMINGNDLYVKMADGSIRHFPNVPESTKVNVDGQMLGIHELKVGMHLQRTITTTTTSQVVTTTKTVTGKVWHVNPPLSVILTLDDGKNQEFKIPKGQKFNVNGQTTDAWGLQKGMIINATQVVEQPVEVVAKQVKLTGQPLPTPPPPPQDQPVLVAVMVPVPAPAPAAPAPAAAPAALPKTGSSLPLISLLGMLSLLCAGGLRLFRSAR
jgi:LPXTG-motif cell wall-anchored protein